MISNGAEHLIKEVGIGKTEENNGNISLKTYEYLRELLEDEKSEEIVENHHQKLSNYIQEYYDIFGINDEEITEWEHFEELLSDERYTAATVDAYADWALSNEKNEGQEVSVITVGRIASATISNYESNQNNRSLLERKAKNLIENNPKEAKAIIILRKIINGD